MFILLLAGLTSVGMYVLGRKWLGYARGTFGAAVTKMLESIGIVLAFCLVNLVAGMLIVLVARRLTGGFVSLYLVSDLTLLVVSLVQGLLFQYWRESSPHRRDAQR